MNCSKTEVTMLIFSSSDWANETIRTRQLIFTFDRFGRQLKRNVAFRDHSRPK
jgi:hypothetical protein